MSDPIDQGDASRELLLEAAIAAARRPAQQQTLTPSTECANGCGDPPRERSRYCCAACRDEDERRQQIRRRQGLL